MNEAMKRFLVDLVERKSVGASDAGGNIVCHYCGDYLAFTQRDGRAPGAHLPDCLWRRGQKLLAELRAVDEYA